MNPLDRTVNMYNDTPVNLTLIAITGMANSSFMSNATDEAVIEQIPQYCGQGLDDFHTQ